MYTPIEAIEAIKALLNNEYENPLLLKLELKDLKIDRIDIIGQIVAKTQTELATKVLFLKETDPGGVLAVFPRNIEMQQIIPSISCYSHLEQHSITSLGYARKLKEATHEEYMQLALELTNRGYSLTVLNNTNYEL